jgi:hypothetical protein
MAAINMRGIAPGRSMRFLLPTKLTPLMQLQSSISAVADGVKVSLDRMLTDYRTCTSRRLGRGR